MRRRNDCGALAHPPSAGHPWEGRLGLGGVSRGCCPQDGRPRWGRRGCALTAGTQVTWRSPGPGRGSLLPTSPPDSSPRLALGSPGPSRPATLTSRADHHGPPLSVSFPKDTRATVPHKSVRSPHGGGSVRISQQPGRHRLCLPPLHLERVALRFRSTGASPAGSGPLCGAETSRPGKPRSLGKDKDRCNAGGRPESGCRGEGGTCRGLLGTWAPPSRGDSSRALSRAPSGDDFIVTVQQGGRALSVSGSFCQNGRHLAEV